MKILDVKQADMRRVCLSDPNLIDPFEFTLKIHESTKVHIQENVKLEIRRGYHLHADGREIGYFEEKVLEIFPTNIGKEQPSLQRPTPMEIETPPLSPQEPIQIEEVKDDVPATALPTTVGQSSEGTHFELKMDMDEQRKEEADMKLVILAFSVLRDMPKEDTLEEDQQKDDQTQEVPKSSSSFHYDKQIGILTLKRQIFTLFDHKEDPSATRISLTTKESTSLVKKEEMTPEEIATHMEEEMEKRDDIQREIERAKEERLAAIQEQEEEDNAEALALSRLKRSREARPNGTKQETQLKLLGSFDMLE